MPKTKKERAFELFDAGVPLNSPEIKRLQLKGSTKYNYYGEWKKARGITDSTEEEKDGIRSSGVVGKTQLLGGETIAGLNEKDRPEKQEPVEGPSPAEGETKQPGSEQEPLWAEDLTNEEISSLERIVEEQRASDKEPPEDKPPPDKGKEESSKEKARSSIIGEGLAIQVKISVKSMALFEDARHRIFLNTGEKIMLGDFIDTCIEDFYKGRGMDLGIVQIVEVKHG